MDKEDVLKRLKAIKKGSDGWCSLYTAFGRKCVGVCPLAEKIEGCGLQSMIIALEIEEGCCQDTCLKSLLKRIQFLERDQEDYYDAAKINHCNHQADHEKIESLENELQRIRDYLYAIGRKGNGA